MIFVYVDRYISPFEGGRGDVFIILSIEGCFYNPKYRGMFL